MRWIGLTGKMAAGKDYTYTAIARASEYFHVFRVSFADGLRYEIQQELAGSNHLDALWDKPLPDTVRRLLQWWGTDLRRAEDPDYWVKNAIERAKTKKNLPAYREATPIFTDVRFPNEADAIRSEGGIIVRVWAPPSVREERLGTQPPEHESETAMDSYAVDMVLRSDGDHLKYYEGLQQLVHLAELG